MVEHVVPVDMVNMSHYLQGFIYVPGGWPWDFCSIESMKKDFLVWFYCMQSVPTMIVLNNNLQIMRNKKNMQSMTKLFGGDMFLSSKFNIEP